MTIEFELNGEQVTTDVSPDTPLREVLREEFGKTGVKVGCLSGRCGVCTIHIDGQAAKSCLVLAGKADGKEVTTIEGIAEDGQLHEVQEAFVDNFSAQCGYCTPGFIMSAVEYTENGGSADRDEIKAGLKGNLCRCTGYKKILDAVESVAQEETPEAND